MIEQVGSFSVRYGALHLDGNQLLHFNGSWAIYDAPDPEQGHLLESDVVQGDFPREEDASQAARKAGVARAHMLQSSSSA